MKAIMASRWVTIPLTLALIAVALVGTYSAFSAEEARSAVGAFSEGEKSYIGTVGSVDRIVPGQSKSTTTVAYINTTATASSTIVGSLAGADSLILNVQSTASSSLAAVISRLQISIDVSNDGIDWYNRVAVATSTMGGTPSNRFYYAGEVVDEWSVSTTTATGNTAKKQFFFEGLYGKYYRVRLSTIGSNQAIWAEAYPIIPIPR